MSEHSFSSIADFWKDDVDMQKAEPAIFANVAFKMPVWNIVYQKKNINAYDMSIRLMASYAPIKDLMKMQGFFDLDLAFKNPVAIHPQVKVWRETKPQGKDKPLLELTPDPFLGRRCYQATIALEQTYEWQPVKEVVNGKEQTKKKVVDGKEKDVNEKVLLKDKEGKNLLKLGNLTKHKKGEGANITLYVNTFQFPQISKWENGPDGKPVEKKVAGENMIYHTTKGVIFSDEIVKKIEEIELILNAHNELKQKTDPKYFLNKVNCFIVTKEVKEPADKSNKYAEYECIIDHIHFLVD